MSMKSNPIYVIPLYRIINPSIFNMEQREKDTFVRVLDDKKYICCKASWLFLKSKRGVRFYFDGLVVNAATSEAENLQRRSISPLPTSHPHRPCQYFESQRRLQFVRYLLPLHEMAARSLTRQWRDGQHRLLVVGRLRV